MIRLGQLLVYLGRAEVTEIVVGSGRPITIKSSGAYKPLTAASISTGQILELLRDSDLESMLPDQDTGGVVRSVTIGGTTYRIQLARRGDSLSLSIERQPREAGGGAAARASAGRPEEVQAEGEQVRTGRTGRQDSGVPESGGRQRTGRTGRIGHRDYGASEAGRGDVEDGARSERMQGERGEYPERPDGGQMGRAGMELPEPRQAGRPGGGQPAAAMPAVAMPAVAMPGPAAPVAPAAPAARQIVEPVVTFTKSQAMPPIRDVSAVTGPSAAEREWLELSPEPVFTLDELEPIQGEPEPRELGYPEPVRTARPAPSYPPSTAAYPQPASTYPGLPAMSAYPVSPPSAAYPVPPPAAAYPVPPPATAYPVPPPAAAYPVPPPAAAYPVPPPATAYPVPPPAAAYPVPPPAAAYPVPPPATAYPVPPPAAAYPAPPPAAAYPVPPPAAAYPAPPPAAAYPAPPPVARPAEPRPRLAEVADRVVPELLAVLVAEARARHATDLHVSPGQPALMRSVGQLLPSERVLDAATVSGLLEPLLGASERAVLAERGYVDLAFDVPGRGGASRLRANISRQRGGLKGSFRLIWPGVPTLEALGLPGELARVTHYHQGLVVIAGPSGHGKTTTLAAVVDLINASRPHHILSIEDPIEVVHPRKLAVVSQRAVGLHTLSFATALKASLREDPDVIVIGEVRDRETVEIALTAAETGHLVIATMSTPSAAKTIDRVIDMFPPADQTQVRVSLAAALRFIVTQRLLPTRAGDRVVPAVELLTGVLPVAALIRDNKLFQLPSVQQRGRAFGMIRFDDSLLELVRAGQIDEQVALAAAENPREVLAALQPAPAPGAAAAAKTSGRLGGLFKRGRE